MPTRAKKAKPQYVRDLELVSTALYDLPSPEAFLAFCRLVRKPAAEISERIEAARNEARTITTEYLVHQ